MTSLEYEIKRDIAQILNIDMGLLLKHTTTNLFEEPFKLSAEDLLYIYFFLRKKYSFVKDQVFLLEGGFLKIDRIVEMVRNRA